MRTQPDLRGRTIVITGANVGIGLEAAVDLARMGARVVLTSRDPSRGADALAEVQRRSGRTDAEVVELDLADLSSVSRCAVTLLDRCDEIHVLINNAGLVLSDRRETEQGFEMTFGVNHLGHFLLTNLLLDRLRASAPSRIVNTASFAHRGAPGGIDFADLDRLGGYSSRVAYAQSKLANILFTSSLAERLAGSGVTANCCHPGSVRTQFGHGGDTSGIEQLVLSVGRPFLVPPSRGAAPLVYLAASEKAEGLTGEYVSGGFAPVRARRPNRAARDAQAAAQLWTVSEEMLTRVGFWPLEVAEATVER